MNHNTDAPPEMFRCPVCWCTVRSTHTPGSDDCQESARERDLSIGQ